MPVNYFPAYSSNISETVFGENLGTGKGIYKDKAGQVLRFRSLKSEDAIITFIENQNEILIEVNQESIDLSLCNNITSEFISTSQILNENDFISNSQQLPPSQASVRSYIEANTKLESEVSPKLSANAEIRENLVIIKSDPASMKSSGIAITGNIITNSIGIGAALYLRSDGSFEEAGASENTANKAFGIALETGVGIKNILLCGTLKNSLWSFTPGDRIFLSDILGEISSTTPNATGDIVQMIGYALSSNTIYFNPSLTEIELN